MTRNYTCLQRQKHVFYDQNSIFLKVEFLISSDFAPLSKSEKKKKKINTMSRENNWVLLSVFFNHVKMWEVLNFNT